MKLNIAVSVRFLLVSISLCTGMGMCKLAVADDLPVRLANLSLGISHRSNIGGRITLWSNTSESPAEPKLKQNDVGSTSTFPGDSLHLTRNSERRFEESIWNSRTVEGIYTGRDSAVGFNSARSRINLQGKQSSEGVGGAVFSYLTGRWDTRGFQVSPWIHGSRGGGLSLRSRF